MLFFTPSITLIQERDKFSSLSADRIQQHGPSSRRRKQADRDQRRGLSLRVSYRRFRNENPSSAKQKKKTAPVRDPERPLRASGFEAQVPTHKALRGKRANCMYELRGGRSVLDTEMRNNSV